jgi:hypothetical protein
VTSKYIELANSIGLHLQEYQVEVMDIQKLTFYTVNVDSYTEDQFEGENLNKFLAILELVIDKEHNKVKDYSTELFHPVQPSAIYALEYGRNGDTILGSLSQNDTTTYDKVKS